MTIFYFFLTPTEAYFLFYVFDIFFFLGGNFLQTVSLLRSAKPSMPTFPAIGCHGIWSRTLLISVRGVRFENGGLEMDGAVAGFWGWVGIVVRGFFFLFFWWWMGGDGWDCAVVMR